MQPEEEICVKRMPAINVGSIPTRQVFVSRFHHKGQTQFTGFAVELNDVVNFKLSLIQSELAIDKCITHSRIGNMCSESLLQC